MKHGQYCKSGTASMKLKEKTDSGGKKTYEIPTSTDPEAKIAVCLTIDGSVGITDQPEDMEGSPRGLPFECNPDGKTQCLYKKNGQTYFKLLCECGLREENG